MSSAAHLKKRLIQPASGVTADPVGDLYADAAEPANDARVTPGLPMFMLTDAMRAQLAARAAKVDPSALKALPPYLDDRLRWMGGVLATAWVDQSEFARVPCGGEEPVTVDELRAFGYTLEYVRELAVGRAASAPRVATLSGAALRRDTRAAQVTLCNAIPLWFTGKTGESVDRARAVESEVRAAHAGKRLSSSSVKLLKVFDEHPAMEPWLRALPRAEGAALDALRALHPEWVRREHLAASGEAQRTVDDRAERVWALLAAPLARVLLVGRYLTRGRPDRQGAYRGFHRPKAAKPRAVKPAPVDPAPINP